MRGKKAIAMSYMTPVAVAYKENFSAYVSEEVKKQGYKLTPEKERHFYVDALFYFDRKDKDANNYWKVLLDAITDTQLIWEDDNVVCERVQAIRYDPANPRIELSIRPVNYIGIFDTASQFEEFNSNCLGCSRHKRNCKILKQATEGRVQEEVQDGVCSKFTKKKD